MDVGLDSQAHLHDEGQQQPRKGVSVAREGGGVVRGLQSQAPACASMNASVSSALRSPGAPSSRSIAVKPPPPPPPPPPKPPRSASASRRRFCFEVAGGVAGGVAPRPAPTPATSSNSSTSTTSAPTSASGCDCSCGCASCCLNSSSARAFLASSDSRCRCLRVENAKPQALTCAGDPSRRSGRPRLSS